MIHILYININIETVLLKKKINVCFATLEIIIVAHNWFHYH